jgi:hypothetical protein
VVGDYVTSVGRRYVCVVAHGSSRTIDTNKFVPADSGVQPPYDPRFNSYGLNETALAGWRNAYIQQYIGTRRAKVMIFGDSITARSGSDTGSSGNPHYDICAGGRLRTLLATRTGVTVQNAGTGIVQGNYGLGTCTVTTTGTWGGGTGAFGSPGFSSTAGDTYTATFTSAGAGTFRFWYRKFGNGGASSTVTLDGGAAASVAFNGSDSWNTADYAIAGAGAHTWVLNNSTPWVHPGGWEFIPTV